ncbi:hypothetical protein [Pseudoalteromonas sp. S1608]|uniref:hypothetical protein n=1 Tax=Pseudoalteromonas sp. S1608 TaxID=579504 RepID=UPI00110B891B|nr:hypothetical protein [Pseudoalteromonas sp. S1608]TMP74021.1 hypothetical protein CWB75_12045 [Pseudoalteromonas sp. S1608]
MKGLYINVCSPIIPSTFSDSLLVTKLNEKCTAIHKTEYLFSTQTMHIVGWFIYKGKLNNFEALSNDLKLFGLQTLEKIDSGVYSGVVTLDGDDYFFIDKMGLSIHFLFKQDEKVIISAALQTIKDNFALTVSDVHESILRKRGHLFGPYTQYQEVTCIPPGGIVSLNNGEIVSKKSLASLINPTSNQLEQIPSKIKSLIKLIPEQKRCLALSGGFDSRLILSQSDMQDGYCYGPKNSADRPIARQFKANFKNFYEFEFDGAPATSNDVEVFDFLVESPRKYNNPHFISAYYTAFELTKSSDFFFDGYLGDVFKRGTYLYFPGLLGEIYRFFPLLYKVRPLSAQALLKKRYNNLTVQEFTVLFNDFELETQELNISDYNKVILYESFLARGRRYISRGALVINGCFKEVVPVFMSPDLQSIFVNQDYCDAVTFKNIKKVWQNVDSYYKNKKFENGYSLNTPSFMMPKLALFYRLLINFMPGFQNYSTKK